MLRRAPRCMVRWVCLCEHDQLNKTPTSQGRTEGTPLVMAEHLEKDVLVHGSLPPTRTCSCSLTILIGFQAYFKYSGSKLGTAEQPNKTSYNFFAVATSREKK